MHGTFDYKIERRADRSIGLPLSPSELAEFGRWAAVVLVSVLGLAVGAFVGLVTGLVTGLIPLC